jgi:putative ABC transport system permease protein
MIIVENFKEGLRSISSNMLRTVLTALIIAIGITSLVGILTAIEGIQSSVNTNFANLGANSFDIKSPEYYGRRNAGKGEKIMPPISYHESMAYLERFGSKASVSISTSITGAAEVKYNQKKTNPNIEIVGSEYNYLNIKGYKLADGRNFSNTDIDLALNVAIIGADLHSKLFEKTSPIGKEISALGMKYKVIGLLEKKGSMDDGGTDRQLILPLQAARNIAGNRSLNFNITTSAPNMSSLDAVMGEATGVMRTIRKDPLGQPDSFVLERSDSFAREFGDITGYLRLGGFAIGFITLLGASIALMNIMMVSVTERTREIGIRKSLGATPRLIREQFLIEAIVICLLGGFGGLVLGIGIGNFISTLITQGDTATTFVIPWVWIITGIVISVVVGIVSGIIPAIKASKLDPIESLRYE